jgi:hypothetical protein
MPTTKTVSGKVPDNTPVRAFRKSILSGEVPSFGTILVGVLIDHFGNVTWMEWDPDSLAEEVHEDFNVELPIEVRDQIWAFVTALTTDSFYQDPMVFNHISNSLSGGPTPMANFEACTIEEAAWAVLEVGMSDLEDNEEPDFSQEVAIYVGSLLTAQSIKPFPPLDFAVVPKSITAFDASDADAAAMDLQDRQALLEEISTELESRLQELHSQVALAGLQPVKASGKQPSAKPAAAR